MYIDINNFMYQNILIQYYIIQNIIHIIIMY